MRSTIIVFYRIHFRIRLINSRIASIMTVTMNPFLVFGACDKYKCLDDFAYRLVKREGSCVRRT